MTLTTIITKVTIDDIIYSGVVVVDVTDETNPVLLGTIIVKGGQLHHVTPNEIQAIHSVE